MEIQQVSNTAVYITVTHWKTACAMKRSTSEGKPRTIWYSINMEAQPLPSVDRIKWYRAWG